MADIILIQPKNTFVEKAFNNHYLPLGLLSICRNLTNYKIKILDQRIEKDFFNKLMRELNKKPICVGITSQTGEQITYALDISKFIKENSDIPVVWGGNHISLLPKQTIINRYIDYGIIGEGELTFPHLLERLQNNKSVDNVQGLVYKSNEKIFFNRQTKLFSLEESLEIPYELIDMNRYILNFHGKRMLPIETSRGCQNNCAFCTINGEKNTKWRGESVKKIISRIIILKEKYNIDGISIQDMNFFGNKKRALDFAKRLIEEKRGIFWACECPTNVLNKMTMDELQLIKRSNCRRMMVGLESGSDRILKLINKPTTLKQNIEITKKLKMSGIPPYYSFIGGFPGETIKELKSTIKLMLSLVNHNNKAKVSIFHQFKALPSTTMFEFSKNYGLKEINHLEEWSKITYGDFIDYPWIDKNIKDIIELAKFTSMFIDKKYEEIDNKFIRLLAMIYQPIAIARLKKYYNSLFIEKYYWSQYVN